MWKLKLMMQGEKRTVGENAIRQERERAEKGTEERGRTGSEGGGEDDKREEVDEKRQDSG